MELIDRIVKTNPNLYFIEGFYGKHYLIKMIPSISEVKISYELLSLLRTSHDNKISIIDAAKDVLGNMIDNEHLKLLLKQINWLDEKGMINLI